MASRSLTAWLGPRAAQLDEIEAAHRAVRRSRLGRQRATEQVNHAYAVLLSSQFQGFCRDLHSECVDAFVRTVPDPQIADIFLGAFLFARRIDRGNPTPENLAVDFGRLGLALWSELRGGDSRSGCRGQRLEQLCRWRNAIAHQAFEQRPLVPERIDLRTVRRWRRTCDALARSFDRVAASYLATTAGSDPWPRG